MKTLERPLLLHVSLLGALLIVLLVFFFLPYSHDIRENATTFHSERAKESIAIEERQNNLVTEREYDRLSSQASEIDTYFVNDTTLLDALGAIESAGSRADVKLTIENFQQPPSGSSVSPFTLNVDGPYPNILRFLQEVEALDVYVSISDASLLAGEQTTSATFHSLLTWQSPSQ